MASVAHRIRRDRAVSAFTLIELLAVMAIMSIIMGIAMVAFKDWGRGAAIRSAVLELRSHVSGARQYAITHRKRTTLEYGNVKDPVINADRGYCLTTIKSNATDTVGIVVGDTNFMPQGVVFEWGSYTPVVAGDTRFLRIRFKSDGSCSDYDASESPWISERRLIAMKESKATGATLMSVTTTVYRLTGRIKIGQEGGDL